MEIAVGTVSHFLYFLGIIRIDMTRKVDHAPSPEKEHIKELGSMVCPDI